MNGGDSDGVDRAEPETLLELTPAHYRHPKGHAAFSRMGVRASAGLNGSRPPYESAFA